MTATSESLAHWMKTRDNRGNFGKAGGAAVADYTHSRFDARQRRQIADGIKRHLHEVGLSRKKLVRHDLKLSTINKALTGQFSDGTLAKLEAILGRRFEPEEPKGAVSNEALVALGGYSLSTTASFQGRFAVRPRTRSVR